MRIGLTGAGASADRIVQQAVAAEADGFASLWFASAVLGDPLAAMAAAGNATTRIELGTSVLSHVVQMGAARAPGEPRPTPADLPKVDDSPVRCFDADAEAAMITEVEAAAKAGDSLGGVVEVLGYGVPPGLGSHVHWDRKIDGLLAQALMSIQAMKGVEIGDGFEVAGRRGSEAHDSRAAEILELIRSLPEAYRETLVLRLVEGMTGPEIAERTGLTAASVRVNLHRGMKQLREKLGFMEGL